MISQKQRNKSSKKQERQDEEIDINKLKRQYEDNFEYAEKKDDLLIEIDIMYSKFLENLEKSIELNQSSISLICGQIGIGKKSCVRYSVYELNKKMKQQICLIDVDAYRFSEEKMLLQQIINKFKDIDKEIFKELNAKNFREESNGLTEFMNQMSKTKKTFVIMIDNFQELAKAKKQSLLYTILELVKNYRANLHLVGVTKHCHFKNLLEKRLSSRFQAQVYSLFSLDVPRVRHLLIKRAMVSDSHQTVQLFNEKFSGLFKDDTVFSFYSKLINTQPLYQNIPSILIITKCCLYSISSHSFLTQPLPKLIPLFISQLNLYVNSNTLDFSTFFYQNLSKPQLVILLFLHKLQKINRKVINFEEIISHYQIFIKSIINNNETIGSTLNFSRNILFSAFSFLIETNFIKFTNESDSNKNYSNCNIHMNINTDDWNSFYIYIKQKIEDSLFMFLENYQ